MRTARDKGGYLLVEWLAGIFLWGMLVSGFCLGGSAYERLLAVAQTETAAREFARDILRVRDRALAGSDGGFLELRAGGKGYWVCRGPDLVDKKRDFASGGSSSYLRFSSIPSYVIRFSVNGSPSTSGQYILQHERVTSVQMRIELQPVTGRVQIVRIR